MTWQQLLFIFAKTGASAFGGWSTTALLLEKELVTQRKLLDRGQLDSAIAYAQMLPGATQVAIVSNLGYRLRGYPGALLATAAYLLPALSLITLFAVLYFSYISGTEFMAHLGGLVAALGGIILANAYRIGKRHASHWLLWLAVAVAVAARWLLDVNVLAIVVIFGALGLIASWLLPKKRAA